MNDSKDARPTAMQLEANRRADAEANEPEQPQREVHTYPDGSQVVGCPPFPEKSPLEREAELKRQHAAAHGEIARVGMQIPQGVPTSGAPAPSPLGLTTESEFQGKVVEQLQSDIASGKSPDTPNPTTSSDKPELAGISRVPAEADVVMGADLSAEDIAKMAASINVGSDLPREPTQAEIDAAVTQVARETKGPVVTDEAEANLAKEDEKKREADAKAAEKAKAKK